MTDEEDEQIRHLAARELLAAGRAPTQLQRNAHRVAAVRILDEMERQARASKEGRAPNRKG